MVFTTSSKGIKGKQNTIIQKGKVVFFNPSLPHLLPPARVGANTPPPSTTRRRYSDSDCFFPTGFTGASMRKNECENGVGGKAEGRRELSSLEM